MTIALAESCTGGLISERLTNVSGSSRYVLLNVVTYSVESKTKLLGVDKDLLDKYGSVSPECAKAMAEGVRNLSGCDIGLSVTGVAGPAGGSEDKPVGLVYLGLSVGDKYYAKQLNLGKRLGRYEVRWRTAQEALNMVRLYLIAPEKLTG